MCGLIVLNMVLQLGLLRVMSFYSHVDSQQTTLFKVKEATVTGQATTLLENVFLGPRERQVVHDAHKDALCLRVKGVYHCMPASSEFVSEWETLDINKDGVWTISEARSLKGKKFDHSFMPQWR